MAIDERRTAVRVAKPLEIRYAANCPPIAARTSDLSESGAFVDTPEPLAAGSLVDFWLALPDGAPDRPVAGRARVVWAQPTVGMGLAFEGLAREDRDRIKFYVASVFFGQAS
jgi:hypothetical protein